MQKRASRRRASAITELLTLLLAFSIGTHTPVMRSRHRLLSIAIWSSSGRKYRKARVEGPQEMHAPSTSRRENSFGASIRFNIPISPGR